MEIPVTPTFGSVIVTIVGPNTPTYMVRVVACREKITIVQGVIARIASEPLVHMIHDPVQKKDPVCSSSGSAASLNLPMTLIPWIGRVERSVPSFQH